MSASTETGRREQQPAMADVDERFQRLHTDRLDPWRIAVAIDEIDERADAVRSVARSMSIEDGEGTVLRLIRDTGR